MGNRRRDCHQTKEQLERTAEITGKVLTDEKIYSCSLRPTGRTKLKEFDNRYPVLECGCGATLLSPFSQRGAVRFKCMLKGIKVAGFPRFSMPEFFYFSEKIIGRCPQCPETHALHLLFMIYFGRQYLDNVQNPLRVSEFEVAMSKDKPFNIVIADIDTTDDYRVGAEWFQYLSARGGNLEKFVKERCDFR